MRVRFLVDAQLPPALARWLSTQGHQADPVVDLGLVGAKDRALWTHAAQTGAVIVTKDEPVVGLSTLYPGGPLVVWLRVGNTARSALLTWFSPLFPDIERALAAGEKLVEVT